MLAPLSVSLVALFTEYAYAQVVKFARTYGGTNQDIARFVQQTSDGGYIVAGSICYPGHWGYCESLLMKTDAFGNVQWTKIYRRGLDDFAAFVQQTSDGGYILASGTYPYLSILWLILLAKTDANGNISWAKTYEGPRDPIYYHLYPMSIKQTSDGGYIVLGFVPGHTTILIKTDANGNLSWAKTYRVEIVGTTLSRSIQQTSDGGYIVAGYRVNYFDEILLFKTDANGNLSWIRTYAGGSEGTFVQQTSDGGYIVAGYTLSFGAGNWDIILVKTDANGDVQWAKTYGGANDEYAYSVQQTSDGGYIVAGHTRSFGAGNWDIILVKTDANGDVQWAKTYGGSGDDIAYSVQQTSDGGYIVAGHTRSFGAGDWDIILVKTDANGNIGSCGIVQNVTPTVTTPSVGINTRTLPVYSIGLSVASPSPTVTSPTFTVTAPCPLSDDNDLGISESCKPVSGLITPYKGGIKVRGSGEFEVKVYNVSGVMVKSVKGKEEVKLELPRGVYFVEVVSGGKVIREKVIIR